MNNKKRIGTGIEFFSTFKEANYYLVDKTLLIKDIIENGEESINLITRPRRFGKTLSLTMLKNFFETENNEYNRTLFEGLNVEQYPEIMEYQGKYPVMFFTLKDVNYMTYEETFTSFKSLVKEEVRNHKYLLSSSKTDDDEKELFKNILNDKAEDRFYYNIFKILANALYKHHGVKPVILIDEYDVPLQNASMNGFYDEMLNLIRGLFSTVFKTSGNFSYAVITGCLRISKESIFTGLNNLSVNTIKNERYNEYFGFTEEEVKEMLDYYGLEEYFPNVKTWYDGYLMGGKEIYNPWSIINFVKSCIDGEQGKFLPYWANTSGNDIIRRIAAESNSTVKDEISTLIDGGSVTKQIYDDITYRDIDVNNDYLWTFLLYTGYLKPISTEINPDGSLGNTTLKIPNLEVKTIYRNKIREYFNDTAVKSNRDDVLNAVITEDTEEISDVLCDWLLKTISYFDGGESFYHGILLGLLSGFDGYSISSNRESGKGRYDVVLKKNRKREVAYIFEFKIARDYGDLEPAANRALEQIENLKYEEELKSDYYKRIVKYGIAFYGKDVFVTKAS